MFGFGNDKKIQTAADEYVSLIAQRADQYYRVVIHDVVQILVDMGLTQPETAKFLGNPVTKMAYTAGIAAEQLQAARNVMGPKIGEKFEKAVFRRLDSLTDPVMRSTFKMTQHLLAHCRIDGMNARTHTVSYMLMVNDLESSPAMQRFGEAIYRTMINATMMSEGDGVIIHLAPRHGLATPEWIATCQ